MFNDIIELFLAGYIFITVFNWLTSTKMELYVAGIWSLLINKMITTFFGGLHSIFFVEVDFDENIKVVIYVLFALCSAILVSIAFNSVLVKRILGAVCKRTFGNNAFKDAIDFKKRTMMLVYLKDSKQFYGGIFKLMDERGAESYIVLTNYCVYGREDNQVIRDCSKSKMSIIFTLREIEYIEVLYEEDSAVLKWLVCGNEQSKCTSVEPVKKKKNKEISQSTRMSKKNSRK